jgi:hypothetical protein
MTLVVPPIPSQILPFTLLGMIFAKMRRLTGMGTTLQIPDMRTSTTPANVVCLSDYVNSFYNYDLPAEFRSLILKDKYIFNTIQGIDTYPFDSEHYTTVQMPCYCAKKEIQLFQDPWNFYGVYFNWQQIENFAYGTGTDAGTILNPTYIGRTHAKPILRSVNNDPGQDPSTAILTYPAHRVQNILITANTEMGTLNATDNGNGQIIQLLNTGYSFVIGDIDYKTGEITIVDFIDPASTSNPPNSIAVPAGWKIQIQYNPEKLAQPLAIMFFQNQFTMRPVPDRGYTIELIAYRQPVQALMVTVNEGGSAELNEWWELIAVGAAKKVYEDRLDSDGVALMDKMLMERYSVAQSRTYAQLGKQSISTIFRDQLSYNYGSGFGGCGGSGLV